MALGEVGLAGAHGRAQAALAAASTSAQAKDGIRCSPYAGYAKCSVDGGIQATPHLPPQRHAAWASMASKPRKVDTPQLAPAVVALGSTGGLDGDASDTKRAVSSQGQGLQQEGMCRKSDTFSIRKPVILAQALEQLDLPWPSDQGLKGGQKGQMEGACEVTKKSPEAVYGVWCPGRLSGARLDRTSAPAGA